MPDVGRKAPPVAYAEDYDDRRNTVRPQTRVDARVERSSPTKPSSKTKRDAASDSGYSSVHSGATAGSGTQVGALQRLPIRESTRSNITAIRRDSAQKDKAKPAARSQSTARPCTDPACGDPQCRSQQNQERRYVLPNHQPQPVQQPYYNVPVPPAAPQYPHIQATHPMAMPVHAPAVVAGQPVPVHMARRPSTSSRARPHSVYGTSSFAAPQPHGPPPSPSAYHHDVLYAHPAPQPPPLSTAAATYGAASYSLTTRPSPTTPTYTTPQATAFSPYSARRTDPAYAAPAPAITAPLLPQDPGLVRTLSARHTSTRAVPTEYATYDSDSSSSYSESSSDVSTSPERRRRRRVDRDRKLMPPPSRPKMPERHTEPVTSHSKIGRSALRRSRDFEVAYLVRPEQYEAERRRQPSRRRDSSYSSSARLTSDATTSSGRTKSSSLSAGTSSDHRYTQRGSQRQHDEFDAQDVAEAYQRKMNGFVPEELTAEKIRQGRNDVHRTPRSRTSRHSYTSSKSKTEGVTFEHNGTVFHVMNGTIAIDAGDEGTPTSIFIDSSGASNYDGARSNASRVGRDRARSVRRGARDEDGYEPAL